MNGAFRSTGPVTADDGSTGDGARAADGLAVGTSKPIATPPPDRFSARTVPPIRSTTSRTIARPRPEPGMPRAVSARWNRSNTLARSASGMPGPRSSTVSDPAATTTSMGPARLIELAGVVDQVGDRPVEPGPWAVDDRWPAGRVARHAHRHLARPAPADPRRHIGRQLAEFQRLDRLIGQLAAGHRDEFVHEVGQFDDLEVEVVEDLALHHRLHVGVAAEHRQVGPQAGEGCAQLVAGVLHEALLLGARQRERVEHPAERGAETAHLVAAGAGHLDIESTGRADVLGCLRQATHRRGHRAGDQPTHGRRSNGYQENQDERAPANVVEHGIDLVEPATDLYRTDRPAGSDGVDPVLLAIHRGRRPARTVRVADDLLRRVGHRKVAREIGIDGLPVRVEESNRVDVEEVPSRSVVPHRRRRDQLIGGGRDRAVELVNQSRAGRAVADHADGCRGDERDGRRRQRDLPPQVHGAATTVVRRADDGRLVTICSGDIGPAIPQPNGGPSMRAV